MNILLLREQEEEGEQHDKYHVCLGKDSDIVSRVTSIPVLAFQHNNLDKITEFIANVNQYSGLIFTSRRAIVSLKKATSLEDIDTVGRTLDVYVVGRATADCAKQLRLTSSKGKETGNAKELSDLIINEKSDTIKPLMFLCGNLARETIPKRLTEKGIPNESISCYRTIPDKQFEHNLKNYLDEFGPPDIIVFFSPSGVEFHEHTLKRMCPGLLGKDIKTACIGSYTSEAVVKLGFEVAGVAEKPTPEALFDVVKGFDR